MDRNSFLCPLHCLDASHFCLCQSGLTYVCSSCFSKHEGHDLHPVEQLGLLQLLNQDRPAFQARLETHKACSEFLDLLSAREAVVQSEATDLLDRLVKRCTDLLERRHRGLETVIEQLREETEMLLTAAKLRLSPLAQTMQEKGSALGQREVEAFLAFPERSALQGLLSKAEEGCVGSQRVWQRDYEDQILEALSGFLNESSSTVDQSSVPLPQTSVPLPPSSVPVPQAYLPQASMPALTPLTASFSLLEIQGPLPDTLSPECNATFQRLGPYVSQDDEHSLVKRGPISVDGGVYTGQWNLQQQRHGQGKQTWADGRIYEGQWRYGKLSGKGRLIGTRGDAYIGDFEEDKYHGFGLQYDVEGGMYIGGWSAGKRHGIGHIRAGPKSPIAGGLYYGDLLEGSIHGSGVLFFGDGSIYAGGWKAGYKHGKGLYSHPKGALYCGEYQDGIFNGAGLYLWSEGHEYRGEWKVGKRWGMGRMIQPGQQYYEGPWVEDKENGTGLCHFWDGHTESIHFRNGVRV